MMYLGSSQASNSKFKVKYKHQCYAKEERCWDKSGIRDMKETCLELISGLDYSIFRK